MFIYILQNHVIERFWVEVNMRVNKPIKDCLQHLISARKIDMDCPIVCFSVSWIACRVSNVGITLLVQSWNHHVIPGMFL